MSPSGASGSSGGQSAPGARDDELVRAARDVLANAYSPYSKVRIGAALGARDGRTFAGCNVENASYGLTVCAERAALFAAVAGGARAFDAIAIVTDRERAWMPCGACRQVLLEFAPALRVLVEGRDGRRSESALSDLLPDAFEPGALG